MDPIIVAKVLGVYLMLSGVFMVTQKKTFGKIVNDLFAHRAVTYIIGLVMVLGGYMLIQASDASTPLIIKIFFWAIALKGVAYIFAPEWLHSMVRSWSSKSFSTIGVLTAAVGVYLYFFLY